jgi:phosphatidylinositol glycan class B
LDNLGSVPDDAPVQKHVRALIYISLVAHLAAGFFSEGFYDPDEQFQVMEYVALKMGRTSAGDLAWEFSHQIRPWFQATVFTGLTKMMAGVGIESPFVWAIGLRTLSAVLGWASLIAGIMVARTFFSSKDLRTFIFLSCLLWFFPFLHARGSSENWSGSLFFLGLAPFLFSGERGGALFTAGLCFGLSFESRYQMGISIVFLFLWALGIEKRKTPKDWGAVGVGLGLALILGTLCDRWGYGQWQLTPWNYFKVNLIEGEAARHGVSPVLDYFTMIIRKLSLPVGGIFILSALVLWIGKPKSWLTWVTLSFILVHSFIRHKEFRFLFPLINALPFFLTYLWSLCPETVKTKWLWRPLAVLNALALLIISSLSARPEMSLYRPLYDLKDRKIFYTDLDPYKPRNIALNFFRPPGMLTVPLYSDRAGAEIPRRKPFWLFDQHGDKPGPHGLENRCRLIQSSFPRWIIPPVSTWIKKRGLAIWNLYECQS